MTTDLRTSQVETLRWALKLESLYGPFEASDLAWRLSVSTPSAARRLKALVKSGHMQVERGESANRRFYRLTQLGHEALEGSDG